MAVLRVKQVDIGKGAELFRSLGEESRIRILHLIHRTGQMCISDMELILDFTQTKTSRHLSYLKGAGLVRGKKVDQWIYYQVSPGYTDILERLFGMMKKDAQLVTDLKTYRTLYSNNELAIRKWHQKNNIYQLPELN
jgi:ArsR family transcriptional regulator